MISGILKDYEFYNRVSSTFELQTLWRGQINDREQSTHLQSQDTAGPFLPTERKGVQPDMNRAQQWILKAAKRMKCNYIQSQASTAQ